MAEPIGLAETILAETIPTEEVLSPRYTARCFLQEAIDRPATKQPATE